jgi:hypothetical protein
MDPGLPCLGKEVSILKTWHFWILVHLLLVVASDSDGSYTSCSATSFNESSN